MWVSDGKVLATLGGDDTQQNALQIVESKSEVLCMEETQGTTTERRTTNGVNRCHLDDLAQRKHVGIHWVQQWQTSGWAF